MTDPAPLDATLAEQIELGHAHARRQYTDAMAAAGATYGAAVLTAGTGAVPKPITRWLWPGSIPTAIVDGDTFDATVSRTLDVGFHIQSLVTLPIRLRLNRINAEPESHPVGAAAKARVQQLLTLGVPVLIETVAAYKYGGPNDEAGEWMAEVTLPDGTNLSDRLVAEGLAVYWNGQGPRPDGPPAAALHYDDDGDDA